MGYSYSSEGILATQHKHKPLEPHRSDGDMDPGLWGALPDEIVDRILAFLPLPCFFRLQVVCKRWNSLRFSHGFLEVYSEVVTPRPWLLVFAKGRERPDFPHISNLHKIGLAYNFMLKRVSFLYNAECRNWYNLALPCLPPQASILAASGGLLCCEGGMGYFLVCNPVTNTWRPLPPSLLDRNSIQFQMVTEQSTRSYMVIAVGGSFFCQPGTPPSDDYRVRLVLNRLRTSAFGASCSGCCNDDYQPRSYPGFATAHDRPACNRVGFGTLLPSSGSELVPGCSVSTTSSNCAVQGGVGANQLRVLRCGPVSGPRRVGTSVREVTTGQEEDQISGSTGIIGKLWAANLEVPPLTTTLTFDTDRSVQTTIPTSPIVSSSCAGASHSLHSDLSTALGRLHMAVPRHSSVAGWSSENDSPMDVAGKSIPPSPPRSRQVSLLGILDCETSFFNVTTRGLGNSLATAEHKTVNEDLKIPAIMWKLGTRQHVNSIPLDDSGLGEHVSGVSHDDVEAPSPAQAAHSGGLIPLNSVDSSFLLPAPPGASSGRVRSYDGRIGLAELSTIAQPTGPSLWCLGDRDESVGLASILDHANLRLSRDTGHHLGQSFSIARNSLRRSAEASESRHSDYRLGITLNGIRSTAVVPGITRSNSSDRYGFTVEVYDSKIGRWERAGLLPREVDSISRTSFCNGFLYCLAFNLVQILRFNMLERSWTSIEMPVPFFFVVPDLVELNGHLLLVGGVKEMSLAHCILIWELDQTKLEWTEVVRMPEGLCEEFHRGEHFQVFSCAGNGSLIFFMSENFPRILVFNFENNSWDWSPPCHGIENRHQRGFQGFGFQPRLDALV